MTGPITVVKCGGGGEIDRDRVCADVASLARTGRRMILVHGGGSEISSLASRLGVRLRNLRDSDGVTSRYSDPATVEVVTLAMAGLVGPRLVRSLAAHGVPAASLTGFDAGVVRAKRKPPPRALVDGRLMVIRDDYSGRIVEIRSDLLFALLGTGVVPVVSPPAVGEEGEVLNVDADRVAAAVAVGTGASELVLLTDKPGLLRDAADERTVLDRYELPSDGSIGQPASGGMRRKLLAARVALLSGVEQVVIADARGERPAAQALAGAGTTVTLRQPSDLGAR